MKYLSTRNNQLKETFTNVLFQGLSKEGGLFLPIEWPSIDINTLRDKSYEEVAFHIINPFIGDEIAEDEMYEIIQSTYKNFKHCKIAPLIKIDNNKYILELIYGPTFSFKDRVVAVAVSKAIEFGFDTVSCASTGNLANSVAAHAAEAGLKSCIFIPDGLEAGKILGTLVYGSQLIAVKGSYDDVNRLCSEIAVNHKWAFVNINIRPYYGDGSKSYGYEIAEQLGWKIPDNVVVPVAGSSLITKIWKAFHEFEMLGLVEKVQSKIFAAQATGCSPVTTAIKNGSENIVPVKPNTIAKSIAIGNPADGYYGIKTANTSGGYGEDVSDQEVVESMKLLAETEGIFTETAGGVTVGVTKKLIEQGRIKPDETTVICITGNGLKTQEALADCFEAPIVIEPKVNSFEEIFENSLTV